MLVAFQVGCELTNNVYQKRPLVDRLRGMDQNGLRPTIVLDPVKGPSVGPIQRLLARLGTGCTTVRRWRKASVSTMVGYRTNTGHLPGSLRFRLSCQALLGR